MKVFTIVVLLVANVILAVDSGSVIVVAQKLTPNNLVQIGNNDENTLNIQQENSLHYYNNFVKRLLSSIEFKIALKEYEEAAKLLNIPTSLLKTEVPKFKLPKTKQILFEYLTSFSQRNFIRNLNHQFEVKERYQKKKNIKVDVKAGTKALKTMESKDIETAKQDVKLEANKESEDSLKHLINHCEKYREVFEKDISQNLRNIATTLDNKKEKDYRKRISFDHNKAKQYYHKSLKYFKQLLKLFNSDRKIDDKLLKKLPAIDYKNFKANEKYKAIKNFGNEELAILQILKSTVQKEILHQENLKEVGANMRNANKADVKITKYLKEKAKKLKSKVKEELSRDRKLIHDEVKSISKITKVKPILKN